MLGRSLGWGLSRLRLGAALRAPRAGLSGSGGAKRPGSASEVPTPGPALPALKEWTLRVSPFGQLRARLPCHLVVRPLDPLAFPDGDRVRVAVCGEGRGRRGLDRLRVEYDRDLQEMAVLSDNIDPRALVEVDAPLKFDLNVKASGSGCIKVQNIECDNCKIETEQGTSILQSVKSQNLHVQTKGGNVICLGTVYGNIDIHASDKSTVTVDKLQGSCVNISTEDGLLKAEYLYTESSFLSSAAGDITLGSVHGNIILQSKMGNITVDSSSGCLRASTHQGAIDVYVSQLGEVELKSQEGSVIVKVPSSLQAYLKLSGKEVVINPEVHVEEMTEDHKDGGVTITGLMNQASKHERWINAAAPKSTVNFRHQSWFQSLNLQDAGEHKVPIILTDLGVEGAAKRRWPSLRWS